MLTHSCIKLQARSPAFDVVLAARRLSLCARPPSHAPTAHMLTVHPSGLRRLAQSTSSCRLQSPIFRQPQHWRRPQPSRSPFPVPARAARLPTWMRDGVAPSPPLTTPQPRSSIGFRRRWTRPPQAHLATPFEPRMPFRPSPVDRTSALPISARLATVAFQDGNRLYYAVDTDYCLRRLVVIGSQGVKDSERHQSK